MNYERPELLEKLSGAYVLGTMAARARPRFARLLSESPAAQRAVAKWQDDLAPLNAAMPPMAPPDAVWQAIAARTGAAAAVADTRPAPRSWWHSLLDGWGRPAIGFCLGIALTGAFVSTNAPMLGMHHMDAALPASYVGILNDASGKAVLAAGSHRHGNTMKIKLFTQLSIPAGKVARLWALPAAGAPVAIATVPASGEAMVHLHVPAEVLFANVPDLAVTVEADPAATVPTPPYVLSGHCVKFW